MSVLPISISVFCIPAAPTDTRRDIRSPGTGVADTVPLKEPVLLTSDGGGDGFGICLFVYLFGF